MKTQITAHLQRKVSTSQYENETISVGISEEIDGWDEPSILNRLSELEAEVRKRVDAQESLVVKKTDKKTPISQPQPKTQPQPSATAPESPGKASSWPDFPGSKAQGPDAGDFVSEAQSKRFFAIAMNSGWKNDVKALTGWLRETYGVGHARELKKEDYEEAVRKVEKGPDHCLGVSYD